MDKKLLSKIISGQASDLEKEEYYHLISGNKEEEELFFEAKNLWVKSGANNPVSDSDLSSGFDVFWKKVATKNKAKQKKLRVLIFRYAAIAVLLVGLSSVLSYFVIHQQLAGASFGPQKFVAERGSLAHFELPDGTLIWLNSGSEILFSQDNEGGRQLQLKGEAFFNVKNAPKYPFVVSVDGLKIQDLGTIFNVKAYPEDANVETTLIKGKVQVLKSNNQQVVDLKPGEHLQYEKAEKKITISNINTELISAWKDGKFAFREERLEKICFDLENWYDVKFIFKNEKIKDFKYSGVINRTTTIGYVLKMLKVTTNINYKINEKMYEPDEIIIF